MRAGITDFAPHSFRGVAACAMLQNGMTLEDVMKKAGWSNAKTFQRFYHKPVLCEHKGQIVRKKDSRQKLMSIFIVKKEGDK